MQTRGALQHTQTSALDRHGHQNQAPPISYGSSDLQAFHRHWTYFAILGWVQFNDHILETGLFKRMRALEKPQEKSYRPPRALKLDRHFPTMKFELIPDPYVIF